MPHLIIEYSANVAAHHDIDALVDALHQATIDFELGPLAGLRTRATPRQHFRVADGGEDLAFVAIVARIGPGREAATKRAYLDHILDRAQRQLSAEGSTLAISWSMEIQEIDADFRINRSDVAERLQQRSVGT